MIQGGGIEIQLEDMLVDYINQWTANVGLMIKIPKEDTSDSTPVDSPILTGSPAVHAGMLPKNQVGQVDINSLPVFPFILCHITSGKDRLDHQEIDSSRIYTKIICGVWDDNTNYQGYRDAVSLLRRIVRKLWYQNTIGISYQLDLMEGNTWRVYDSDAVTWPFFIAEAIMCWKLRRPFAAYESEGLDAEQDPAMAMQPMISPPGISDPDTFGIN